MNFSWLIPFPVSIRHNVFSRVVGKRHRKTGSNVRDSVELSPTCLCNFYQSIRRPSRHQRTQTEIHCLLGKSTAAESRLWASFYECFLSAPSILDRRKVFLWRRISPERFIFISFSKVLVLLKSENGKNIPVEVSERVNWAIPFHVLCQYLCRKKKS